MSDSNTPAKWADLRPDEREAILEFAQLSPELRQRIYKAGRNIMWWEGLANRLGAIKWVIVTVMAIGGGLAFATTEIGEKILGLGRD